MTSEKGNNSSIRGKMQKKIGKILINLTTLKIFKLMKNKNPHKLKYNP